LKTLKPANLIATQALEPRLEATAALRRLLPSRIVVIMSQDYVSANRWLPRLAQGLSTCRTGFHPNRWCANESKLATCNLRPETCPVLVAFHKPYGVLSQFTRDDSPNRPLAEFGFPKNVYALGRLDADSEGLLLLGDEARWNEKLLHPRNAHEREYWVQVEKIPAPESLQRLEKGVFVQGRKTLPCHAWLLEPPPVFADGRHLISPPRVGDPSRTGKHPTIFPRIPPIRFRKSVPDCWIGLELVEGKNRQVRRMTAAIGHPTLRLLRVRIGNFWLGKLQSGEWRVLSPEETQRITG